MSAHSWGCSSAASWCVWDVGAKHQTILKHNFRWGFKSKVIKINHRLFHVIQHITTLLFNRKYSLCAFTRVYFEVWLKASNTKELKIWILREKVWKVNCDQVIWKELKQFLVSLGIFSGVLTRASFIYCSAAGVTIYSGFGWSRKFWNFVTFKRRATEQWQSFFVAPREWAFSPAMKSLLDNGIVIIVSLWQKFQTKYSSISSWSIKSEAKEP